MVADFLLTERSITQLIILAIVIYFNLKYCLLTGIN